MNKRILFLIICSFLLTQDPSFAKDPALVRRGFNYIKRGYIKNAIPTFKRAVKAYPKNSRAHYGLALSSFKQGGQANFDIAITHFKKALELNPNNFDALKSLARILSWSPETRSESLSYYRRAKAINPKDADLLNQMGEVLLWSGNSFEALEIYSSLYKSKPTPKMGLKYANALTGSKRYSESLDLYQKGIKAKVPFDEFTNVNYARALNNTGNTDQAIAIFYNLLKNTKDPQAISNIKQELGSILFDSGKYLEAIEIDSSIPDKNKDILMRLARSHQRSGNTQQAVNIFENVYNTYPDDADVQRSAAGFLSSIGGYNNAAIKIYETMIDKGMANTKDKIALADLYNTNAAKRGNAIELYKDLLQKGELSNTQTKDVNLKLARAYASIESTRPDAIYIYRQLLAEDPHNQDLQFELLELLSWQDSTRREALIKYWDLVQNSPNNPQIYNKFDETLGWYLPEESDLSLLEEILSKHPSNTNALKGMSYIASQKMKTDKKGALEIFNKLLSYDPENIDIQLQMANVLSSDKDTRKDAVKILQKIHQQQPDNVDIKASLANNLLYEKKFKQAKKIYNQILTKESQNKDAMLGIARIYGWQNLNLAAYKAYGKVYDIYPDDPDVAYEYASVAKKLGRTAKALKILQKINGKSMLPDAPGLPEIAMAVQYQMMSTSGMDNFNPTSSSQNIENLQNDLVNIQKDLENLQAQIDNLKLDTDLHQQQEYNVPQESYTTPIATQNNTQPYEVEELSDPHNNKVASPFERKKVSLPDPIGLKQNYTGEVVFSHGNKRPIYEYQRSAEETALLNDPKYNEIVYNSEQQPVCYNITGFQDALAGRRYSLMRELFGDLRKDILYNMRPELRTSFVFSNEAGDPTTEAMEIHGYPSFMSVNLTPTNRFRFGVNPFTYGMTTSVHPASISETRYSMGLHSTPHERVTFDGELNISSFSDPNAPVDVTARARLDLKLHDRLLLKLGYRREPLYQSVFETTGYTIQPQYNLAEFTEIMRLTSDPRFNPNNARLYRRMLNNPQATYDSLRGPFLGQVRDNAVSAEVTFIPFNKWDLNAGYEYSAVRGEGIEHNGRHQAQFSFGRTFTGVKDHLFRLGYQFLYFGYRKDLSAYPNMVAYPYTENGNLVPVSRQLTYAEARNIAASRFAIPNDIFNDPTGGTVTRYISPVDFARAPQGVGIGGYFSPTQFYLNSFRFDLEGKLAKGRLYYRGGASLGVQQFGDRVNRMDLLAARGLQNFANIAPNDPRRRFPAFAANANAADRIQDSTDPTSLAIAFDFTAFLKITDFLTIYSGVDYLNSGAFDRWRYNGGLILRPDFKALSPIFRKPKVNPNEEIAPDADAEADADIEYQEED